MTGRPAVGLLARRVQIGLLLAGALEVVATREATAQSTLDRPPALSGGWVGNSGTVYFHFVHRFSASGAPERKVTNAPSFLVGAALPWRLLVGLNYATNSTLADRFPNEHEYFVRYLAWTQRRGAPLDVGVQLGYNDAARGMDGEISLSRTLGPLRVVSAGRVLADPAQPGHYQGSAALGAVLRLTSHVALAGDVGSVARRSAGERVAWSTGLHLQIPSTPHTLSLHATNLGSATLQGHSRGAADTRYGFEFTIPVTLRRYLGARPPRSAMDAPAAPGSAVASMVVRMSGLAFVESRIKVPVGATVEWRNDDPVGHTVTFRSGTVTSPLIASGAAWRHTFTEPGTYPFYCTPHPFMQGVVVVE